MVCRRVDRIGHVCARHSGGAGAFWVRSDPACMVSVKGSIVHVQFHVPRVVHQPGKSLIVQLDHRRNRHAAPAILYPRPGMSRMAATLIALCLHLHGLYSLQLR